MMRRTLSLIALKISTVNHGLLVVDLWFPTTFAFEAAVMLTCFDRNDILMIEILHVCEQEVPPHSLFYVLWVKRCVWGDS